MQKPTFIVPPSHARVPVELYLQVRKHVLENDQDGAQMFAWSNDERQPPATPEDLAGEVVWIILCAGRSAQSARTIEKKVWAAIEAGKPAVTGFGYRAKAAAIDRAWAERENDFQGLQQALATGAVRDVVHWCGTLPYVGAITRYQLAKNVGQDLVKPDIWLSRLVGLPDRRGGSAEFRFDACMALCAPLVDATGDSFATCDSMLWLACNKGILQVDANAGPVTFQPAPGARSSIYGAPAVEPTLDPTAPRPTQMPLAFESRSAVITK